MTKVNILKKLIAHYETALGKVKLALNYMEASDICNNYSVDWGICTCAKEAFDTDIHQKEWVAQHVKFDGLTTLYWYVTPFEADTITEIIECLQLRINKMKKILRYSEALT